MKFSSATFDRFTAGRNLALLHDKVQRGEGQSSKSTQDLLGKHDHFEALLRDLVIHMRTIRQELEAIEKESGTAYSYLSLKRSPELHF